MSISLSRAVTMMIGTCERCRSWRQTSVPDISGSIRSSSTMSAPVRSNSVSAAVPVAATETSKPSLRSMYDRASENDSSSSTTSTRATDFPSLPLGSVDSTDPVSISIEGGSGRAASGGRAGSRRVNVEPPPSVLATSTRPPWLVAMCLTIARPRPVPPVARDRAWSAR